jgi:peptidylprolyl isomerase
MKLRSLAAAMTAFALSSGVAMAQTASTSASTAAPASEKTLASYGVGYQFARDLVDNNADLDFNTVIRGIQDGYAKKAPSMPEEQLASAVRNFQDRMASQMRAKFDQALHDNKAKSDAFLAANRSKPGVITLPSGVQYRIIEPGTGARPTATGSVDVQLRGTFTTGQPFMDTYQQSAQPQTVKVSEAPVGLREALLMMPVGSRWEVFIPSDKAYGDDVRSPIGPGQAVVFDIKLFGVK